MRQVRAIDGSGGFHSKVIRTQCVVRLRLMYNIIASIAGRYRCEAFERRQGVVVKNVLPRSPQLFTSSPCVVLVDAAVDLLVRPAEAYLISS